MASSTSNGSTRRRASSHGRFVLALGSLYVLALILYCFALRKATSLVEGTTRLEIRNTSRSSRGDIPLKAAGEVRKAQRFLCEHRAQAERTIIAHLHIQKSGGTAFALALKSECICNEAKNTRPQKGYCRTCPHVLQDETQPPTTLHQNAWTFKNESYLPDYGIDCPRYKASDRWFGFQKRNRTYLFYSLNRLTTGWPCGVHVGYARLRMCCNRLQLRGIRHVMATLFREPLARYVSEYYQSTFNRIHINSWDWCAHPGKPIPFSEYLKMDMKYPFQNRMSKMLSGGSMQASAAGPDWKDPTIRKEAFFRAMGVLTSTEDFIFGLAERLEETLEMFGFVFKRTFDSPSPCHAHQNSKGENCEKVSVGLHDNNGNEFKLSRREMLDFKENNWEDIVLYEEASRIFDIRLKALRELQTFGSDHAIDEKCRQLLSESEEADFDAKER